MIPPAFAAPKVLRRLNIAAVGLALSAITAATFGALTHDFSGLLTGVPTLAMGLVWAWILRLPNTVGTSNVRWGWLASVPLAALNAGLVAGALVASDKSGFNGAGFLGGMVLGLTFGIFFWVPSLVATLVAFGLPIAWGQKLAKKGLAGEERGERLVGIVCMVLAVAAFALSFRQDKAYSVPGDEVMSAKESLVQAGHVFMRVVAVLGALVGAASTALATARESRRRAFVADAESGKVPGFRVDATPEGKALVRVSSVGEGYRVSDFTEEVVLLDEEGRATESRMAQRL